MIIVIAFFALMAGFLFGYMIAALLNFSSKEYDEPTQPTINIVRTDKELEHRRFKNLIRTRYLLKSCGGNMEIAKNVARNEFIEQIKNQIAHYVKIECNPNTDEMQLSLDFWAKKEDFEENLS